MINHDDNDGPRLTRAVRQMILSQPEILVRDEEIVSVLGKALMETGVSVDMRAKAMDNMTAEIARLNTKNEQIIASAFQSTSATDQMHRALLKLAEAKSRAEFRTLSETNICGILRIPHAKIEERYVRVLTMNGLTAELPLDDGHVLVLTGPDPDFYAQSQGTDLLRFFHQMTQRLWATCPE